MDMMGDGVYNSTDAGETWTNVGLKAAGDYRPAEVIQASLKWACLIVFLIGRPWPSFFAVVGGMK